MSKELVEKVAKIQSKLKAPKGQFNKFGGYAYRSCEDILEGVKHLLAEENLILTITDEMLIIGARYYIKATAQISDGNVHIECSAFARETEDRKGMDASQITGATSSYARKYALNGLFLIDDTNDADVGQGSKQQEKIATPKATPVVEPMPDVNKKEISKEISEENKKMITAFKKMETALGKDDFDFVLKKHGIERIGQIKTKEQAIKILKVMDNLILTEGKS